MRWSLLFILLWIFLPSTHQAQETGWPIVENCLGELPYPTIPQEDWDFEGVIFNHNWRGVRAIRTDVASSYFIAFEDNENFPAAGSFSPDGRWLVYPTGERRDNVNIGRDSHYHFRGLAVVSADPRQLRMDYELPQSYWSMTLFVNLIPYSSYLYKITWLDNENLIYVANDDPSSYVQLNIPSGELRAELPSTEELIRQISSFQDFVNLEDGNYVTSIPTESSDGRSIDVIGIFNSEGEIIEEIARGDIDDISLSSNHETLLFLRDRSIHLADLSSQTIEDLCLELPYNVFSNNSVHHHMLIWSPDDSQLAFLYDGYPVLLNLATREMQILRYETWSLKGWYPLNED